MHTVIKTRIRRIHFLFNRNNVCCYIFLKSASALVPCDDDDDDDDDDHKRTLAILIAMTDDNERNDALAFEGDGAYGSGILHSI